MQEIFIFRHGQTDWNKIKRCQGSTDIPLNSEGIKQAKEIPKILRKYEIDIIYSSHLKRALKTAEIVSQELDIKVEIDKRFMEVNLGDIEGMLKKDAIEKYGQELWDSFLPNSSDEVKSFSFPGGESSQDVLNRINEAISEISSRNHKSIGICSHGGILRNFIHNFVEGLNEPIEIPNCVIYRLFKEDDKWSVEGPLT